MKFRPKINPLRGAALLVPVVLLAAVPASAFAYLDPSTGSMIVSAIIGIFASIALAVKTYWYKLKNLFRRKDGSSSPSSDTTRDS